MGSCSAIRKRPVQCLQAHCSSCASLCSACSQAVPAGSRAVSAVTLFHLKAGQSLNPSKIFSAASPPTAVLDICVKNFQNAAACALAGLLVFQTERAERRKPFLGPARKLFSPKCVLYVRLYVPFPWSCLRSLGFVLLCYLAVMLSYVRTDVLSQVCLQMCALISVQSRQVCAMSLACERMARGGSQPSAAHVVLVVGMVLFYRCMWYRIHFALCT